MRTPRLRRRRVACLGLAALVVVLSGIPTGATAQEAPPVAVLPELPDELDPITEAISPVMWQACNGVGLAVGLIVVAGTLAGVPPDVGVPLNEAIASVSGPVLLAFFEVCQQIPLPEEPPDCDTDELIPLLPSLGRPFLPAALLANELRALDATLGGAGLGLEGALSDAADDLLACSAGRNPERDPPARAPEPGPGAGSTGGPIVGGSLPSSRGGGSSPAPAASVEKPAASGLPLPAAQPINSSDGGTGTGLAVALLGLAALAALGWLHAGNPR